MSFLPSEANAELSTEKPGSAARKEISTSSFTQGPAALQPTSLEQVQQTPRLSFKSLGTQQKLNAHNVFAIRLKSVYCCKILRVLFFCSCQLEEDEAKDSFDVDVAVTNPEKVGQYLFVFLS